MSETKLKPCPFCGADEDFAGVLSTDLRHWVECRKCGACGPEISSRYFGDYSEHLDPTMQAWAAWRSRTDLPPEPTP